MSNWHNDNWSGNDSAHLSVEIIPRPIRRVLRFSIRFYLLVVCVAAFAWSTYAGIQAIRRLSAAHTLQPPPASQHRQPHSTKGQRP